MLAYVVYYAHSKFESEKVCEFRLKLTEFLAPLEKLRGSVLNEI